MRVGLVVYGSLDVLSGGNLYDRHLVRALERRHHTVVELSLPRTSWIRHLGHNLGRRTWATLTREPVDLLLQDELVHPSLFALNRRLRRRVSYPLVGIVHHLRASERHPRPLRFLYRLVERRFLGTLDGFVYNSPTTRRETERLLGEVRPHVVAPPAGDRWEPAGTASQVARRDSGLRLLFVGNVIRRKGLETLVEALAALRHRGWRLEVVGSLESEPAYARRLRRRIREAGLDDRITFRGQLDDEALGRCFQDADLLVVPSTWEGFGIVYLEAMGFALPVVATTAGGAADFVRDGENGILVPPGDRAALARRLEELAEDRTLLRRLGERARRTFEERPTWQESMDGAVRFLERMAGVRTESRGLASGGGW